MKLSRREMFIGVATLFVALFAITYWLGGSKIEEHRDMRGDKVRLERQIQLHQRILEEKEGWTARLDELQKQLPVYDRRIHVSGEVQKRIKRIADKSRLDFTQSRSGSENRVGNLYELSVACNWEGGLEALVRFLYELNEQGLQYDVHDLSIRPDAKRAGILRGDITIACAYLRAEKTENTQ